MRATPAPRFAVPIARIARIARTARIATVLALLLFGSAASPAPAQDAPPAPPSPTAERRGADTPDLAHEKADRRRRAAEAAGDDAVLLVLSPEQTDGVPGTNRNPDFEYLSPLSARQGAVLVAAARRTGGAADAPANGASAAADRIYLPQRNPAMERWTGPEPAADAATAERTSFGEARILDQLGDDVATLLRTRATLYVSTGPQGAGAPMLAKIVALLREKLADRWVRVVDAPGAGRDDVLEGLRRALPAKLPDGPPADAVAKLPAVDVRSARTLLAELREVKSPAEIERIRRAVAATVAGHADAIRAARPGLFEYHLAAIVELRCRAAGCARQAYPSIAGSGPNSCVLHYDRNVRRLADGDLVVLDAGGEYEGYAADVTRTFPVSGRFSDEQAKVYDAVLEAQEAAIAAVRPGLTLRQVHEVARASLASHGLDKWFIHGTSHTVGLEVHDSWRKDSVLRAGCVITVEPGVYDAARSLGVRIEDTVLVTETGCEVLSADLPKKRDAVEDLMREDPPAGLPR